MDIQLLLVIIIFFMTGIIRTTMGFGDAVVAMPLLAMIMDVEVATPLVALLALTLALIITAVKRKKVQFKSIVKLLISSAVGIPVGIWFLKGANEDSVRIALAAIIVGYACFNLFSGLDIELKNKFWVYLYGFIAGILGGTYNTNGPPVVVYGTLKKWNPENFVANLQSYFLLAGVFIVSGHLIAGSYTEEVLKYYLLIFPVSLIAIFIGDRINKKIPLEKFRKFVSGFLILISLKLIFNSL